MAIRRHIHVDGIVQGVGFRPFVYNLARDLALGGWVNNTSEGVFIEVEGSLQALDDFRERLEHDAPPLAKIVNIETDVVPSLGESEFRITASDQGHGTRTLIPVDAATCPDCLREIRDPQNRRYQYPFTNCTNCGPRWTIIKSIPYDRPATTMAPFVMCAACQAEYDDPNDRRFHAQPNACPECGPTLALSGEDVEPADDPLLETAGFLANGRIAAIKGLGGFHLAVRADDTEAVTRLRRRKNREAKPLAVMAADLNAVRALAHADQRDLDLIQSPQAPIVLLRRQITPLICDAVAGDHQTVGVMLPYTPLHHLLFDKLRPYGIYALVMTSGNLSDEPICIDNLDAFNKLGQIADVCLTHNRDILRRADDSVVQRLGDHQHVYRRGRGYAPVPVLVGGDGPPVLAVGAELKNTVCLLKEDRAFVSPHIGDLENLQAYAFFQETIATLQDVLQCRPAIIAHDMHPAYLSSQWARQQSCEQLAIQHHHAHMAAVLAEHRTERPAIGLIMDGTGYGPDRTIWGGEILTGDAGGFQRLGHFEPVPLPGGDAAIRKPWRTALSYLRHACGDALPDLEFLRDKTVEPVLEMLIKDVNSPLTSSCGRLFDAVAAMTGHWDEVHYEAQAAIELMALTTRQDVDVAKPYPWEISAGFKLLTAPIIEAVAQDLLDGSNAAAVSARFHRTLIDLLAEAADWAARQSGLRDVVLAGGVFQNEILLSCLNRRLESGGFKVLSPIDLPPNDGAIAVGQAVIARAVLGEH
jgi:hydrogenase maturation protein HypF